MIPGMIPGKIPGQIQVTFVHPDGRRETHAARAGDSVMDCAVDNGVAGIPGRCGGGCTCATCHCYVDSPWRERLPPPSEDEIELLRFVAEAREDSRLTCQIAAGPELDGIVVRIPAERRWAV